MDSNQHILNYNRQQRERLLSLYGKPLEKGGEGSRGGKIIGHTKSGKPIYEHSIHNSAGFSHQDHSDAVSAHMRAAKEHTNFAKEHKHVQDNSPKKDSIYDLAVDAERKHQKQSGHHSYMAQLHSTAMNQKLDEGSDKRIDKTSPGDSDQKTDLHFDKRQAIVDMLAREKGLKKSVETDELQKAYENLDTSIVLSKSQNVSMNKKELVNEHENLIEVLESPSHTDDEEEAEKQRKELEGLEKGGEGSGKYIHHSHVKVGDVGSDYNNKRGKIVKISKEPLTLKKHSQEHYNAIVENGGGYDGKTKYVAVQHDDGSKSIHEYGSGGFLAEAQNDHDQLFRTHEG